MKQFVVALVSSCFFVQVGFSQSSQTTKLNDYFKALEQHDRFMGTISVKRAGENVYSKSVGFSNLESKTRNSENTTYVIGSISKSFTAVMIFQSIEKGKLALSTTLNKYFPSIKNAEKITIDHLLSHRSGIHNFIDNNFQSWATEPKTGGEMLEIIEAGGSDFVPDSKAQYSNSNYVLLSYILETIYNQPFSEILQMNISVPLKLSNTYFGRSKTNQICNSYKYLDKWRIESNTDPSVLMGAGGIISTANDLNTFFHSLFCGKLISTNSLEQMKTIKDGYGKGLLQIPFGNKIGYGHTGGIDGFSSVSAYYPDDQTAYSLTSNGANYIINNISIAILSIINNVPYDIPSFETVNLTSQDLDKYLGIYSTQQLPMKLTVSKRGKILVAQGTGQPSFDLEASAENTFRFDQAGIVLTFDPAKGTMILKQGGGTFLMKKE